MTDCDPIDFYHLLKAHQRQIEAFSALTLIIPSEDALSPLLSLLSDSLEASIAPVIANGLKLSETLTERLIDTDTYNR